MTEKIHAHPLNRKAVLYVRQSSLYQVAHNTESPRLQYAMRERLHHSNPAMTFVTPVHH